MQEKYNLEYSESQGFFHYATPDAGYSPTYVELDKDVPVKICYQFTKEIEEKYNNNLSKVRPSLHEILNEYYRFNNEYKDNNLVNMELRKYMVEYVSKYK